jgi:IS30 family transposase
LKHYRASQADQTAWDRAHYPKPCKLAGNPVLSRIVARKLKSNLSPDQVTGWLKRAYPTNESHQASRETIYRSLFIQEVVYRKKSYFSTLEPSVRYAGPNITA